MVWIVKCAHYLPEYGGDGLIEVREFCDVI